MANWDTTSYINPLHEESKSVHTALSAHEKEIFEKKAGKEAHVHQDIARNSLRYLFTIFH
jgi:hypothetical protein